MRHLSSWFIAAMMLLTGPVLATAAPIAVGTGAFFAAAPLITFDDIADNTPILNQYAGLGVTFGPGLFGDHIPGDYGYFSSPGTAMARNADLTDLSLYNPVVLHFSAPVVRVGMFAKGWEGFRMTVAGGSLDYDVSGQVAPFVGLEDLAGFTQVAIERVGSNSGFLIDGLRFDLKSTPGTAPPVPEPSVVGLLGIGLGAVMACSLRKRRR
jgi:hypothetical protein